MAAFLLSLSARRRLGVYALLVVLLLSALNMPSAHAAEELSAATQALNGSSGQTDSAEEARIETTPSPRKDSEIQTRIAGIFSEIDGLDAVQISVVQGVVTLSGETANEKKAQQAISLASRLTDVVTVNDAINRTLDVQDNVSTVAQGLVAQARGLIKALPLLLVGIILFGLVTWFGAWLSRRQRLWQRLAPNPFVAELMSQTVRVIFVVFGLILALSLVGAETILGTLLGGAGVIGLAVGFAVKDTIENYIASLMLSIRQPFQARDQVVINGQEGIVVRLTSRATILMTLDGNQLRIPNADVFKGTILNYTSNPERRFTFELGVDADDDPLAAIKVGLDAIHQIQFVLNEPRAVGLITQVGDSNIVLEFQVWVDQSDTDFGKARSITIRETKHALEHAGFSLPEPIYRLRFNASLEQALERFQGNSADANRADAPPILASSEAPTAPTTSDYSDQRTARLRAKQILGDPSAEALFDARPDEKLMKKVEQEIARNDDETDLLNKRAPQE
ncbi:mechanosensitive ion channel family protein [Kushneria phyllosphaerae]|uniref:Small-conductance mechanosensitive channel n=1 Tax=Kushneria phyllosphaerae TaxID=2100822 RepID=A0A2R8CPY1_9GAMM|nr:mechanosensitive ion channel family protein [Kushneria phyllosphaerae]SPJ34967.1 Small-conductance mechanosensitive channel [Kushneria phyllosphaerae]